MSGDLLRRTRAVLGGSSNRSDRVPVTAADPHPAGLADRAAWVATAQRLADPVLTNLAAGTLRLRMPVEEVASAGRGASSHLEAVARLLAGIAPWLELGPDDTDEGRLRDRYRTLALDAIRTGLDPASPDALDFSQGSQPLVEAAYLGLAVLRAPRLFEGLDSQGRECLVDVLASTRRIQPWFNNWLLFSGVVEVALGRLGAWRDPMRIDYALRQHDQWYVGDGIYSDGRTFHWDYYDSFVIHPMLDEILGVVHTETGPWRGLHGRQRDRSQRFAAIQERLIGPDGTYPPIGRSLAYRAGAFHALARSALQGTLPEGVAPAQVRGALTAVMHRTLDAPGTFDADGWLRIGLAGHQPGIGERYISTGSLYLTSLALLPLGLPPTDPFWTAPPVPWTSQRAWSGEAFPIDRAYEDAPA